MPEVSAPPSADELFHQWEQFLDAGALATAVNVVNGHGQPVVPLQQRINACRAEAAMAAEFTLTAPGALRTAEPPPDLPDYTVLGPLGEGGMGVVYRVRDQLDREFALKLSRRGQLTAAGRDRFLEEARAMARLVHPHVAPIHSYGKHAGRPYFLMPVYPANLTSQLAEYQADAKKAVRLMAAVAEGVGHLHAHGFIHRDLKPHNILLTADGRPVVSDFGLVKDLAADDPETPPEPVVHPGTGETKRTGARRSRTEAGLAMGTRAYMAPDQAAGLVHRASPKWDVWALGVILHELVVGRRPPSSDAPEQLLDPAMPDNPPPSTLKPGLDPKLERIIQKCLARDESQRYPDARAVAADLRAGLINRPARWVTGLVASGLAGLILVVFAAIAWPAGRPKVSENRTAHLAAQRAKLQAGETVVLIPETGMPDWWQPVHGEHIKPYLDEKTKTFTIDTTRSAYVELFADPGIDRYRFEFEVRQFGSAPGAGQGGYVGRHSVPTGYPAAYMFLSFLAHEHSAVPRTGLAECRYHVLFVTADGQDSAQKVQYGDIPFPGVLGVSERPWRPAAVDVSPTEFVWWFDGKVVARTPARVVGRERAQLFALEDLAPDVEVQFDPRGGLGLYVENSSASFRHAKIVPHRDE
jgi:hypothetical protein